MNDLAIRVEDLSKRYKIGKREPYRTLRDTLTEAAGAPLRRLRTALQLDGPYPANGDDTVWALKDVSFEVRQGEVVGVIGRNGAGKSTLLKILSRITKPTRGFAEIHGRVGSLLEVGTGFHPELTGRENIYLNGAILGMGRAEIERKFDEIVAFAEIEKFLDTPVKRYSSGMYVRLAFAVAAHLEPEILLVDEVLAVGDASFQKKCLGKMEEVATEGRTVLFVSHNMGAILHLCPKSILLRAGQIFSEGKSSNVVKDYLNIMTINANKSFEESNPERSGNGGVILRGGRVLNSQGFPTTNVVAGQPITLEFDYENRIMAQSVNLSLTIYNQLGIATTNLNTSLTGSAMNNLAVRGHFKCKIPKTPFPNGQYRVAIAVNMNGDNLDHIPNALLFTVESSAFFSSSKTPDIRYCSVLIEHHWFHDY